MSLTSRKGKDHRPSWDYSKPEVISVQQLEMMESCRNAMEQVRDELRTLNSTFRCTAFQAIPNTLRRISRNTAKPRRKKKRAAPAA